LSGWETTNLWSHNKCIERLNIFRQLLSFIVNYRQLLSGWETTNIREKSSFSQKLFKFHENYFIFAIFVFTHTHTNIREISSFSRYLSLHTHTNIREISSFSRNSSLHTHTHTHTFAKYRHLLLIIVNYCPGERQRISDLIIINAFKGWILFVNYCHLL